MAHFKEKDTAPIEGWHPAVVLDAPMKGSGFMLPLDAMVDQVAGGELMRALPVKATFRPGSRQTLGGPAAGVKAEDNPAFSGTQRGAVCGAVSPGKFRHCCRETPAPTLGLAL